MFARATVTNVGTSGSEIEIVLHKDLGASFS
jgi:hypothetical protein